MRGFSMWRRNRPIESLDESLNLDGLLAEGLKDRDSARRAIKRLNRERKAVLRNQQALMGDSKTLSPGNVKMIARGAASPSMTELGTYELSRAMRDASDTGASGLHASSQLVMLDERLAAIDQTRAQLYSFLDRVG